MGELTLLELLQETADQLRGLPREAELRAARDRLLVAMIREGNNRVGRAITEDINGGPVKP